MNKPRPPFFYLLLLLVASALGRPELVSAAETNTAKHCLFRVAGKKNTVYLLGTVHLLKKDFYPLAKPIEDAYAKSDKVVFELDLKEASSPAAQKKAAAAQQLPKGKSLEGELSKETYTSLVAYLEKIKVPVEAFQDAQPWSVAVLIGLLEWQRLGYNPEAGVEMYFSQKANVDKKQIGALETAEFQLGLFSGMTREEQEALLKETLTEISKAQEMIDEIVAAWKAGDVTTLGNLINEGMSNTPKLRQKLVTDRNLRWIRKLEEMLKEEGNVFVAVGAGHLGGKEGVLELLKAKGYKVEQE